MNTRSRAVISATVFTLFYIVSLLGVIREGLSGILPESFPIFWLEVIAGMLVSLSLFILTGWTLYFKRRKGTIFSVMLFPSITIFSYVVFSETVVGSILGLGQITTAVVVVLGCWLVTYLLLLTANVLNGAILYGIPLGQAGKAFQFVFSLVGSYLLMAFVLSAEINVLLKVLIISLFVYYWSYSAIWQLKQSLKQSMYESLTISLVIGLSTITLSVWPLATVYTTVITVVLFYVMLNIALENRRRIGEAFWVEYGLLIFIVVALLGALAEWGINGTFV